MVVCHFIVTVHVYIYIYIFVCIEFEYSFIYVAEFALFLGDNDAFIDLIFIIFIFLKCWN